MQYEFGSLRGLQDIFTGTRTACFPSMDYITHRSSRRKREKLHDAGVERHCSRAHQNIAVVPQILTNQAEGFCKVAGMLKEQGYEEVNLNLAVRLPP